MIIERLSDRRARAGEDVALAASPSLARGCDFAHQPSFEPRRPCNRRSVAPDDRIACYEV